MSPRTNPLRGALDERVGSRVGSVHMHHSLAAHNFLRLATFAGACLGALALAAAGCGQAPVAVLTQLMEARQLAAHVRLEFNKAADASNRAVMADTDEASSAAARDVEEIVRAIQGDTQALQTILRDLQYSEEIRLLKEFDGRFGDYLTLDRTILGLAVENTNLKAQRLSFGPAREAADAFVHSLDTVVRSAASKDKCDVDALVAKASAAVREIQLLEAPHIAESDEAGMSRMEAQMGAAETAARHVLDSLKELVPPGSGLEAAVAALDRFKSINTELVALSRRNSDVQSLALSLGRKRTLTAACDDALHALEQALQKHDFAATR